MKKVFVLIFVVMMSVIAQAQDTISKVEVFNGYGNKLTQVAIFTDTLGKYYIETKTVDNDTSFGVLCIGDNRAQARTTLKCIKYFLDNEYVDYLMFHVNDSAYLKLFKDEDALMYSEDEVGEEADYYPPIITDGTEVFSDIPIELIKKAMWNLGEWIF